MKYIMMIVTALIFSACGSDSKTDAKTEVEQQEPTSATIYMEVGKLYSVKKGDKLIKTTDEAIVNIIKKTQEDTTEVVLLEGEAKIIFN